MDTFWVIVILVLVLWVGVRLWAGWRKRQRALALRADRVDQMSGVEFEEYVATLFEMDGYRVQNQQHSSDFGGDLIISRGNDTAAIQCKRIKGTAGIEAVQDAISAREYYEADQALVVSTAPRFSKPARQLADKTEVALIGRQQLGEIRRRLRQQHGQ